MIFKMIVPAARAAYPAATSGATRRCMRTLGQDIYAALRRDIILGRLAARRKLKMADLLDRYDASTSTLR